MPEKFTEIQELNLTDQERLRKRLAEEYRDESNPAKKLDNFFEIVDFDYELARKIYLKDTERHKTVMDEIKKTKKYFSAEFNSINKKLDNMQNQLDKTASKDELSILRKEMQANHTSLRKEMQANQQEIREKLEALLNQPRP